MKCDCPLAHGWLTSAAIQPGFYAYAARYDSLEEYNINQIEGPGFLLNLNLGDMSHASMPRREVYVPNGHFNMVSIDEPLPIKVYRGERKRQDRCGIWLDPDWIAAGMFERFDDTGIIRKKVTQTGISGAAVASSALLSAASRLFGAFNFDGSLAGLRREAAAMAFLAGAFASVGDVRQPGSDSRIETGRIMRVKEMLDSLAPTADVRLVEVAHHHGMSVRSLCRHFRQTFDTTILGYVAERRMANARVALERDGDTIDQAAYLAGFAHVSNFSAAFRRRYGHPPGEVRRMHLCFDSRRRSV